MRITPIIFIASLLLFKTISIFNPNTIFADELDRKEKALKVIADFADRTCKDVSIEGKQANIELSGSTKAQLKGVVSKIAELGFAGAAKYNNSKYEGLLQTDIITALKNTSECKLQVLKQLDKLLDIDTVGKKKYKSTKKRSSSKNADKIDEHIDTSDSKYNINGLQYRPNLRVFGSIKIKALNYKVTEFNNPWDNGVITLGIDNLVATIVFQNKGNSSAILVAEGSTNINTGKTVLRDALLGKGPKNIDMDFRPSPDYFNHTYIHPEDKKEITFDTILQDYSADNVFVLHYFALYKNELGIYYDTYYQLRCAINVNHNSILENTGKMFERIIVVTAVNQRTHKEIARLQSKMYISLKELNESSNMYTRKESKYLDDRFKKLLGKK